MGIISGVSLVAIQMYEDQDCQGKVMRVRYNRRPVRSIRSHYTSARKVLKSLVAEGTHVFIIEDEGRSIGVDVLSDTGDHSYSNYEEGA